MDKVILKAVLSTLLAIVLLFGIMIAALVFVYPSTLMTLTYNIGMDGASAWFADRAYDQFDNVYYIAYATEVSIGTEDPEKINRYGSRFIADEGFDGYCAQMDRGDPRRSAARTGSTSTGRYALPNTASGNGRRRWSSPFPSMRRAFPNAMRPRRCCSMRS